MSKASENDFFYEITSLARYQRSYSTDSDLINKKRIINKPSFISQKVYNLVINNENSNAFFSRIRSKVHSLYVHPELEAIVFYDILNFNSKAEFCINRTEYGTVILLSDEQVPPARL